MRRLTRRRRGRPHQPQSPLPPTSQRPAERPAFDGTGQVLDSRYNHGRYYPPPGTAVRSLPPNYRPYYRGGERYYFNGGIWYAPRGPGFVVVRPPVGLVISVLPPTTRRFGWAECLTITPITCITPGSPTRTVMPWWILRTRSMNPRRPPIPATQAPLNPHPISSFTRRTVRPRISRPRMNTNAITGRGPKRASIRRKRMAPRPAADADRVRNNYDRAMSACLQGRGYQVN